MAPIDRYAMEASQIWKSVEGKIAGNDHKWKQQDKSNQRRQIGADAEAPLLDQNIGRASNKVQKASTFYLENASPATTLPNIARSHLQESKAK